MIVEATRRAGVSVAAVAQAHGVNANEVFYWRKLYDAGQLCVRHLPPIVDMEPARVCLLPVTVEGEQTAGTPGVQGRPTDVQLLF